MKMQNTRHAWAYKQTIITAVFAQNNPSESMHKLESCPTIERNYFSAPVDGLALTVKNCIFNGQFIGACWYRVSDSMLDRVGTIA